MKPYWINGLMDGWIVGGDHSKGAPDCERIHSFIQSSIHPLTLPPSL